MDIRRPRLAVAPVLLVALLTACGGGGGGGGGGPAGGGSQPSVELSLVAYSTPQEAYDQITEAFAKTPAGRNVTFTKSYGSSGDQSRAVQSGLNADIVAFSLEPDMTRLVTAGMVDPAWNSGPTKGMVTNSVAAFIVRKGNPKNIRTWADLAKPGIEVVNPNPFTSGGARWNVMAAYGQAAATGLRGLNAVDAEAAGVDYLNALYKNVVVQDDSARKSLQTFTSGKGDVLIGYENEAIFARLKNQPIDYVVPDSTILIENPVAVTETSKHPEQAQAFLDFLSSPAAQAIFAKNGYRSIDPSVKGPVAFPTPARQFTIATFGGWAEVTKKFFDPAGSIMADVERRIGVSVG